MTDRSVTITSKNQITLPADMVRDMKLTNKQRLTIHRRGDTLILQPLPSLEERMQAIWAQLPPVKGTVTDEELQQAIRRSWAQKKV